MHTDLRLFPRYLRFVCLLIPAAILLAGCNLGPNKPAGPVNEFASAKEAFMSGNLEKALDLTDKLAEATPPAEATDRARVLRAVIYAGELKAAGELAAAYGKGADEAKNPRFQTEYRRLRNDNLQKAGNAALMLAETAHQIAPDGTMPKELTLEANYPTTEGPTDIKLLAHVEEGGWIESDQQDAAAADAYRKGVDDALADMVSGDRSKARQALATGSTKLDGASFALFLAKEMVDGAIVFNRKHGRDPQKLITLCDEGEVTLKAAQAILKDTPNKDQEAEVKKLQEKFKTVRADK